MRSILQNFIIFTVTLFLLSEYFPGLEISGGFQSVLIGAVILSAGFAILKPLFTIITLPIIMASLGLFTFVAGALVIFLATLVYPQIQVTGFDLQALHIPGVSMPDIYIPKILSYLVLSVIIELTQKIILLIFKE